MARRPLHKPVLRTILIRGVPEDLRAQFKARCSRGGTTMTAAIKAMIRKAIEEGLP